MRSLWPLGCLLIACAKSPEEPPLLYLPSSQLFETGIQALKAGQWIHAADSLEAARRQSEAQPLKAEASAELTAGLVRAYWELGLGNAIERELARCFEADPNQANCLYVAGALMREFQTPGSLEAAENAWLKLMELHPKDPLSLRVKAALPELRQLRQSLIAEAARNPAPDPSAANKQPPGHPSTQADPKADPKADSKAASGSPDAGADDETQVGALNAFGRTLARGMQAMRAKDAPGAEAAFREALSLRPDDVGAKLSLAEALFVQDKKEESIQLVEAAYKADPKGSRARFSFGLIMLSYGLRTEEALAGWKALLVDDPALAEAVNLKDRIQSYEAQAASGRDPH